MTQRQPAGRGSPQPANHDTPTPTKVNDSPILIAGASPRAGEAVDDKTEESQADELGRILDRFRELAGVPAISVSKTAVLLSITREHVYRLLREGGLDGTIKDGKIAATRKSIAKYLKHRLQHKLRMTDEKYWSGL